MAEPNEKALPDILKALLESEDVEYITIKIKPKRKKTEQGGKKTKAENKG